MLGNGTGDDSGASSNRRMIGPLFFVLGVGKWRTFQDPEPDEDMIEEEYINHIDQLSSPPARRRIKGPLSLEELICEMKKAGEIANWKLLAYISQLSSYGKCLFSFGIAI